TFGNDHVETVIHQRPDGVFARRTAPEVVGGDKNAGTGITWPIQLEVEHGPAVLVEPPAVEQVAAEPGSLDGLQKAAGQNRVGIDIRAVQRHRDRMESFEL